MQIFTSIYDQLVYNEFKLSLLYNGLNKRLDNIASYRINAHKRELTRLYDITIRQLRIEEEYFERFVLELEEVQTQTDLLDKNDIDYERKKKELDSQYGNIYSRGTHSAKFVEIYKYCLTMIEEREYYLKQEINNINKLDRQVVLEKSESKFILRFKKICYDTHYERVFELFFVLNTCKAFNKYFTNKEYNNFAINYLRKFGSNDKISKSTYSNTLTSCNKESKYHFNLKEFQDNDSLGFFGETNFSVNFTKTDIQNFIDFVNVLFPTVD